MIPVYPVSRIREADAASMERQHISSWQLMERAATACIPYLCRVIEEDSCLFPVRGLSRNRAGGFGLARELQTGRLDSRDSPAERKGIFILFCGKGNNGGDGLAIARLLHGKGYRVEVWLPDKEGGFSPDAARNYALLQDTGVKSRIFGKDGVPEVGHEDILVDALVGTGLRDRLDPVLQEMVLFFNGCTAKKISIDIPSGLWADSRTPSDYVTVADSFCLSFQFPKQAYLFSESAGRPFDFAVLDIGLDKGFICENEAPGYVLEVSDIVSNLPPRPKFSHKGNYGKILLVAGSEGMGGAAVLAGNAALRGGCGLLTLASARTNREIIQVSVPEAVFTAMENMRWSAMGSYTAVGIGPGIGTGPEALSLLRNVLRHAGSPLVIDADGLNLLAQDRTLLEFLPYGRTVLTPHPKEFERLAGPCGDSWERVRRQQEFSNRYGAVIVLKGAHTSITLPASPGKPLPVLYNSTGNPGMATGGSGDVLTGLLLSLLGQGLSPYKAAYTAVYLHGLAGDLAAESLSEYSLKAGDIVDFLPEAFSVCARGSL